MEDLNINVVRGFGIKHKYITKEKSAYICHTDLGKKIIRKVTLDANQILFQHELKKHLHDNGFCHLDMYVLSAQNKPYFEWNQEKYTMTDQIQGKQADFQNKEDFKKVLIGTAQFHKLSENFLYEGQTVSKNDRIHESFDRKIKELALIKKRLRKYTSLSDFDVIFIKHYDYYMELMVRAKDMLAHSAYDQLVAEAKRKNTVCHNVLKEENILFNSKGEMVLSHFNDISVDPHIIDLAELIKRYVKILPEDHLSLGEMIEIYSRIQPVSDAELAVLEALLLFPSKFLKICSQYYSKKRSWIPGALNSRMQNLIAKKNMAEEFHSMLAYQT